MRNWAPVLVFSTAVLLMLQACYAAPGTASKIAIHIEKHVERVFPDDMPEITKEGIKTTYAGVGKINAFVVVYDYAEIRGAAFGLRWPEAWQDPKWQDCGSMRLGPIHRPGGLTNIMLEECVTGGEPVVFGWLTVTVTAPGRIEILPSEGEGAVAIVDCNHASPGLVEVMFSAAGGAGGMKGADISRFVDMENRTWHVLADSSGDALSIDHAVKQAIPGDTIAVAHGVYRETVHLRNGVTLTGSWSPDFKTRDLVVFPSVIDPGAEGPCVIGGLSEDSTCVLDGFVLTGGKGNYGGGLVCRSGSSPTVRNLIIYGNRANLGGGIFCGGSSPLIEDVLIIANGAGTGGGIACNMGASPRILRATIAANAANVGGGIYSKAGAPYVESSIIAHHSLGGGLHCEDAGSRITFACCDLWGNEPSDFGGLAAEEMGLRDNIFKDPMFAGVEDLNFAISHESPCRDLENCGKIGSQWTRAPGK